MFDKSAHQILRSTNSQLTSAVLTQSTLNFHQTLLTVGSVSE